LLLRVAASGHHFGAPNEEAWIYAEGPTDQAEHDDCADPNAAAASGKAARSAAPILNSIALRQFIYAHDLLHQNVSRLFT
jgi:hypothetical protein